MSRKFWLVQRLYHSPSAKYAKLGDGNVKSNPFGYGRLGDYELDYMGSAEFEFGAIPASGERLSKAKLQTVEHDYKGKRLIFLFRKEDGDPFDTWVEWANGKPPFDGKEPTYDLKERFSDKPRFEPRTHVWWSLEDNVMWSFVEPDGTSHLQKMLDSMPAETSELRG